MNRAKRLWLTQNSGSGLAILCLSLSMVQGCSPKYPDGDSYKTDKKTEAPAGTTTAAGTDDKSKTAADKADAGKTADKNAEKTGKTADSAKNDKPVDLDDQLPDIKAASMKVDIHSMPDTSVICTVKNTPITVGDFKEELKAREQKVQSLLTVDQGLEQQLLNEAKTRQITLTDDEKKRLIAQTKKAREATGKLISDYLKEAKLTEKQYEDRILSMGLAAKTFAEMTREKLLGQLVDKTLIVLAAKDKGFFQKAHNKYIEIKVTPDFKKYLAQNGLTAEAAQTKVVEEQLITMFIDDIKEKNSLITEQDIQQLYDDNKDKLKHGDQFKLSQIVIAAPADAADQPGIKQQLKQKFPNLSDKDLDAKATEYRNQQKRSAEDILAKIQKGAKFEDMANQYTDDPANRSMMNGGDIGWKEKAALEPDFVSKVGSLKVGQVYPHVLTTRFGYHIIKLTDKQAAGTTPIATVRDAIKKKLVEAKQQNALLEWMTDQHKSGVIKLSPEFQKLIAPGGSKTQ